MENTGHCRVCQQFTQAGRAASGLADADAIPASAYFRIVQLLHPGHVAHVQRRHPALYAYNVRVEAARQAALGMTT